MLITLTYTTPDRGVITLLHFTFSFVSSQWVNVDTSKLVSRLNGW